MLELIGGVALFGAGYWMGKSGKTVSISEMDGLDEPPALSPSQARVKMRRARGCAQKKRALIEVKRAFTAHLAKRGARPHTPLFIKYQREYVQRLRHTRNICSGLPRADLEAFAGEECCPSSARRLSNGACQDRSTKKFVKKVGCVERRQTIPVGRRDEMVYRESRSSAQRLPPPVVVRGGSNLTARQRAEIQYLRRTGWTA